jgi:RsiW-degrading membrane proteinase PrsW (M82 family)
LYLVITLTAAVVPSMLLLWFFYRLDANPEPRRVVVITFLLGLLIIVPVLALALPILFFVVGPLGTEGMWVSALAQAFLTAAVPEEFCKFLVVYFYCSRHPEFDEPMDGIVYGVTASLGFATLENVLYVWQGGLAVAAARALTAVPCHAFLGVILGYYVGQARFRPSEATSLLLRGLGLAILLHGLYDFPLIAMHTGGEEWVKNNGPIVLALLAMSLVMLAVLGGFTFVLVRRARAEQALQKKAGLEISQGTAENEGQP